MKYKAPELQALTSAIDSIQNGAVKRRARHIGLQQLTVVTPSSSVT